MYENTLKYTKTDQVRQLNLTGGGAAPLGFPCISWGEGFALLPRPPLLKFMRGFAPQTPLKIQRMCDLEFAWDPVRSFATWNSPGIPIRSFATWNSNSGSQNLLKGGNFLNPCLKYPTTPTPCIQIRTFATWNSNSGSQNQRQGSNLLNPCLKYPTPPPDATPPAWGGVGGVFEARIKQIAALK